jgi:hypothetical protein
MKEHCNDYQYLRWEEHGKQTVRYTMCLVEASLFLGHIHNRTSPQLRDEMDVGARLEV